MNPVIFYVDDEPHNLTVFEASLPENWKIYTFDNPVTALTELEKVQPWVIVSDQRMPGMSGVAFLELSKKISPYSVRIIVTGYSDENLVVESVRKAQVFDYIRKPWEPTELEKSLQTAVEYYYANEQARILNEQLKSREEQLKQQTIDLLKATSELEKSHLRELEMRKELECWVPPFVLWSLKDKNFNFPIKKDLVGITFDIIQSSQIHDILINNKPIRSLIIQAFSESIIKHGGWRESHSGDSAYGHFGLFNENGNPFEAALAVAREFRVSLRNISILHGHDVECGIALHIARNCIVDVHTVQLNTPKGIVTQKSFDTTSSAVDMLHRMEKVVHSLPGTNIVMSDEFVQGLKEKPQNLRFMGEFKFKGQNGEVKLYFIPSDKIKNDSIDGILSNNPDILNLKKAI